MSTMFASEADQLTAGWGEALSLMTQGHMQFLSRSQEIQLIWLEAGLNMHSTLMEPWLASTRNLTPFLPSWMVWHNGLEQLA